MQIITAPPPNFPDLTKQEVIKTLQLARQRIRSEEGTFVCCELAYAHLDLNHDKRWPNGYVYQSTLITWVASLIEKHETADSWLLEQGFAPDMKHWRSQWITHLIAYVIAHPTRYFKNLQAP